MNLTKPLLAGLVAALAVSACSMTPPSDLDRSLERSSEHGLYRVKLHPVPAEIPINRLHQWRIDVAQADGAPVSAARIAVDGKMPQHFHGMPTQPRVTGETAPGHYRLEGMKFSMSGWWQLQLNIDGAAGKDWVRFNIVLAD